ncbi:hypothetical protein C8J57DRAFT_1227483 [Mycena rebaudengoi]|nr:hypothetical protein C8J57DRAFT_1256242 [Mycena rebaudengoi]KAJ7244694.1 hypothetical protein C8J57DRAFT_1242725 [Mycena rebaudengoi]KAJ7269780.1 hypothetical protein C8J57DRAFT_1227483 [Mycena rebaudengoi]
MSEQCAVGPDGKLLDAKTIVWYNDPDDAQPLPTAPTSTIPSFFGPRRTGRVSVPSARVTDPDNAEKGKRKAAAALPNPRSTARSRSAPSDTEETEHEEDVHMSDANTTEDGATEDGATEDGEEADEAEEEEDPMTAYLKTKAFGEADLESLKRPSKANATADAQLIGLEKQRTIDEFTTEVKIPAFTKAGLMDYICELIVTTDEASCIFFAATPCL